MSSEQWFFVKSRGMVGQAESGPAFTGLKKRLFEPLNRQWIAESAGRIWGGRPLATRFDKEPFFFIRLLVRDHLENGPMARSQPVLSRNQLSALRTASNQGPAAMQRGPGYWRLLV